jgi:hypothetical protein
MTLAILVEQSGTDFSASVPGIPQMKFVRQSRADAVVALEAEIRRRTQAGELLPIELTAGGVTNLAGMFRDDPTLSDICDEAYRLRDAEAAE